MMEELLVQLVRIARSERAVASQKVANGMQLLVYPVQNAVVVALGFERDAAHQVRMEEVLRKRSQQLARFGAWLPTMFNDGSCYVVRRVSGLPYDSDSAVLSSDQLMAAQELLT